jgi:hypothetical protein
MCKGVDKGIVMQGVRVVKKTGGKSGGWVWDEQRGAVKPIAQDNSTAAAKAGGTELYQHPEGIQRLQGEDPLEHFFQLIAMDDKEFAAELHQMRRAWGMAREAKKERKRIQSERERVWEGRGAARTAVEEARERKRQKAAEEEDKVRAHVARCEAEVRSGERGRVQRHSLDKAHKERRMRFERSAQGTVLVLKPRERVLTSG